MSKSSKPVYTVSEGQEKPSLISGIKTWGLDVLLVLLGTSIFAASTHFFTAPNHIAPGGVTGISTVINYISGGRLPIGIVNLALNVPIAILGFLKLGKRFMIKTLISLLWYTVCVDYLLAPFPVYTNNAVVAAIFGGVLMGGGIGVLMSRGGSSGGMDIVNKIIQRRLPHLKIGQVVLTSDLILIALSMVAYGEVEPGLFAIITIFLSSKALDAVLYGFNVCKLMYIVTDHAEEIGRRINIEMNRGATILESYGSYTRERRPTVMVAVRQNEYYRINKLIYSTDPRAFVIITSATEIVGNGFNRPLT